MTEATISIYTDGSCNPKYEIGGWAAILLVGDEKIILEGKDFNTTHNRMELLAVIKALEYIVIKSINHNKIKIYSDSQYVVKISQRKEKLKAKKFQTNKGLAIKNVDFVKILIQYIESFNIDFIKIKAHQKETEFENFNREVDKLARKIVRQNVAKKI